MSRAIKLQGLTTSPEDQLIYVDHLISEQRRVLRKAERCNYPFTAEKAQRNLSILEAIRSRLDQPEGTTTNG